jgi:hypothetical protein
MLWPGMNYCIEYGSRLLDSYAGVKPGRERGIAMTVIARWAVVFTRRDRGNVALAVQAA